ncbi:MAG: hypothetical protein GXO83_04570 [Chlorobi bacterium]|nr:hypothetical protein [Chlorobiota bacterium]
MINFDNFQRSLDESQPKYTWPALLKALWWDAKGDWDRAHRIARDDPTPDGARVHAYLHRKEGDLWNADYWYQRAGVARPEGTSDDEWKELTGYFGKIIPE